MHLLVSIYLVQEVHVLYLLLSRLLLGSFDLGSSLICRDLSDGLVEQHDVLVFTSAFVYEPSAPRLLVLPLLGLQVRSSLLLDLLGLKVRLSLLLECRVQLQLGTKLTVLRVVFGFLLLVFVFVFTPGSWIVVLSTPFVLLLDLVILNECQTVLLHDLGVLVLLLL